VKTGSGLKSLLRRLGREILEVRQRQRWRSEGIGIQRLRVDTAVSALDEASGLMKPEPEVRTSFDPDRRSPDDSRISGLRHARTAVILASCQGRPKPDAVKEGSLRSPGSASGAGDPGASGQRSSHSSVVVRRSRAQRCRGRGGGTHRSSARRGLPSRENTCASTPTGTSSTGSPYRSP